MCCPLEVEWKPHTTTFKPGVDRPGKTMMLLRGIIALWISDSLEFFFLFFSDCDVKVVSAWTGETGQGQSPL
jgi:hypothetical protein